MKLDYNQRIAMAVSLLPYRPGDHIDARIEHEKYCPVMHGLPTCKCTPDIYLLFEGECYEALADGELIHHPTGTSPK